MPNDRWDDFALDREFDNVKNFMHVTATLPNQMTRLAALVDENTRRIDSHHKWIEAMDMRHQNEVKDVKNLCERIGQELRQDAKERIRNRVSIVVAIIGAGAMVAAAVITSVPH